MCHAYVFVGMRWLVREGCGRDERVTVEADCSAIGFHQCPPDVELLCRNLLASLLHYINLVRVLLSRCGRVNWHCRVICLTPWLRLLEEKWIISNIESLNQLMSLNLTKFVIIKYRFFLRSLVSCLPLYLAPPSCSALLLSLMQFGPFLFSVSISLSVILTEGWKPLIGLFSHPWVLYC